MNRASGFTLVEVLLAMVLLSTLLALAYGGMHAATRATDRGQQILQESGRLRMAHQFVRKQLNQAIPLAFNQAEGETLEVPDPEVFLGSARSIRFVGPMPGYLGFGGPQVQELTVTDGEAGMELRLSHALVQGFDETHLSEREPIVLLNGIERAEFQFLARDEEGELVPWASVWEEAAELPVAIALDIEFVEGAYADWPLLVAAVKVDGSVAAGVDDEGTYQSAIRELIEQRRRRN